MSLFKNACKIINLLSKCFDVSKNYFFISVFRNSNKYGNELCRELANNVKNVGKHTHR